MSDTPARDKLDREPLEPSNSTRQRRSVRNDHIFRSWCEEAYGTVVLGDEEFHSADILDKLAPEIAKIGRKDAIDQATEDIERTVCERFPATVAIPFHRFLEGSREPLIRLHRLRDTWESLVRLLCALALAEASATKSLFTPLRIRESSAQAPRDCRRRDLTSDKLAVRIAITEAVLQRARESDITLGLGAMVPSDVIDEIRRLNSIRNGFSHEATKSDKQAAALIQDAYPAVRELLLDLRDLQDVRLFRVRQTRPGDPNPIAEIERLDGHSGNQRITDLQLGPNDSNVVMSATKVGGLDRVLARLGHKVIDTSPFLYATDDNTGHRTRLLEFKLKRASRWHLECVGDSSTETFDEGPHLCRLGRFYDLLSSGAKDAAND